MYMTALHQQAMTLVYRQVLNKLLASFSPSQRAAVRFLTQRLLMAAGGYHRVGRLKLLLAYGGGKESTHALTLLRAAQLNLAAGAGTTFKLRVATALHPDLTPAALSNIQRCFEVLVLQGDPRVELLMVDGHFVGPFNARQPVSAATTHQYRQSLLLRSHLAGWHVLASFRTHCYLSLAQLYRQAIVWDGGVDAVIVSDSRQEQRDFIRWGMRRAYQERLAAGKRGRWRDAGLLEVYEQLGRLYHQRLHARNRHHGPKLGPAARVRFISLHDLYAGDATDYWQVLANTLGLNFAQPLFSFSESGCAHPSLLMHLHALRCQYLLGRNYDHGLGRCMRLAAAVMEHKGMPRRLIRQATAARHEASGRAALRQAANTHAQQAFGLSEAQLVCLLFAPVVGQGARLESFLNHCYPSMRLALPLLHRALQGREAPSQITQWLVEITGLELPALQRVYRTSLAAGVYGHG
jgi:hypothetical protein